MINIWKESNLSVKNTSPPLDYSMLYTIITAMLGIAGMRSFDKLKKTDTKRIGK